MLLGPRGASAWLEWLGPGAKVWGGGGRTGMPREGGAGAGANTGDELLGASHSARSMRVPGGLLQWFPGGAAEENRTGLGASPVAAHRRQNPEHNLGPDPRASVPGGH